MTRSGCISKSARALQRGFTLLELLIGFVILAIMAAIIFASFRMALNSYSVSQKRLEEQAVRRVMADQIKRQVGSLFPLRPSAAFSETDQSGEVAQDAVTRLLHSQTPLFLGTPDSVTFITVAPLVLFQNPGLTVVRYGLAQDEYGKFFLGSMETQFTGIGSFQMMAEVPRGNPLSLVDDVRFLEFEYYGIDEQGQSWQWFRSWSGEETGSVPTALRIHVNEEQIIVPINADYSVPGAGAALRGGFQNYGPGTAVR